MQSKNEPCGPDYPADHVIFDAEDYPDNYTHSWPSYGFYPYCRTYYGPDRFEIPDPLNGRQTHHRPEQLWKRD